ncbi:MAG: hypothetical protein ACPGSL_04885 [Vicingaceae bacterium]
MKSLLYILYVIITSSTYLFGQYNYEVNKENPFGKLNPAATPKTAEFALLIGECKCKSQMRAPDKTWNEEVDVIWRWKYIMNGMAVQDETLKADGVHSGSIRQYNADSLKWYVHYYTSSNVPSSLPVWEGSKSEDGKIILYREQVAPNGTDGFLRLTFYNITNKGFNWISEWVNIDETFSYPTWKINCTKMKSKNYYYEN